MSNIEYLVYQAISIANGDKNAHVGFFGRFSDYIEFVPLCARAYTSNSGGGVVFFDNDVRYDHISGCQFSCIFLLDSVKDDPMFAASRLRWQYDGIGVGSVFRETDV
jgi:hypothetical protein